MRNAAADCAPASSTIQAKLFILTWHWSLPFRTFSASSTWTNLEIIISENILMLNQFCSPTVCLLQRWRGSLAVDRQTLLIPPPSLFHWQEQDSTKELRLMMEIFRKAQRSRGDRTQRNLQKEEVLRRRFRPGSDCEYLIHSTLMLTSTLPDTQHV